VRIDKLPLRVESGRESRRPNPPEPDSDEGGPERLRATRLQAPPSEAHKFGHALVVIHGIGQQQPFEPLDAFVNGLRATLHDEHPTDPAVDHALHMTFDRDHAFDHGVRIADADLDIYEVYWAPLTKRKATFAEIAWWLIKTSFTPVQQFAFNLPLLIRKADREWRGGRSRPRVLALIFEIVLFVSGLRRGEPIDVTPGHESELKASWYILCFVRELIRVVGILLAGLAVAALAAALVTSSASLLGELPNVWRDVRPSSVTWRDTLTVLLFASALIATIVVFVSLFPQLRQVFNDTPPPPTLVAAPKRGLLAFMGWDPETRERMVQSNARLTFAVLSLVLFALLCGLLYRFVQPPPMCVRGFCLSDIVPAIWARLGPDGRQHLMVIALVVTAAALVKAFFVNYVADVTLYTVTDENSPFAAVRRDILDAATGKVKWLLSKYETVAVAGHSLGSVIGYDVINRLRSDVRLAESQAADIRSRVSALRDLLKTNAPASVATEADALATQIAQAFGVGWSAISVGHAQQALQQLQVVLHDAGVTDQAVADVRHAIEEAVDELADPTVAPLSRAELNRLKTLVTFGSPLNKVLYFFRTRVGIHQTLRAHIVNDLHGFRLPSELFASDPGISDDSTAGPFGNAAPPDDIYWLNVWAPLDFVSARLDFYDGVHEYRRWYWLPGACHLSYWRDRHFYEELLAALRRQPKRATAPLWAGAP